MPEQRIKCNLHIPPIQSIFRPVTVVLEEAAYQSMELLSIKKVILDPPVLDACKEMSEL